jgi:hypothetical protein
LKVVAKKAKSKVKLVPRMGPPVNLRPGGAQKGKRRKPRAEEKRVVLMEDVPPPEASRLEDEGR